MSEDGLSWDKWVELLEEYNMMTHMHHAYFIMLGVAGFDGEISEDEDKEIFGVASTRYMISSLSGENYDELAVLSEATEYFNYCVNSSSENMIYDSLDFSIYNLSEELDKKNRLMVYEWLDEVAAVDGVIKDSEQALLDIIKKSWKLEEQGAKNSVGGEEDIDKLCEMLENEDEKIRFEAVQKLGKIDDPRVIEPLIEALREVNSHYYGTPPNQKWSYGSSKILNAAKIALSEIAPIEPLLEALKNYTPRYAGSAMDSILFPDGKDISDFIKNTKESDTPLEVVGSLLAENEKEMEKTADIRYEVVKKYVDVLNAKIEKNGTKNLTDDEWEVLEEQRGWIEDVRAGVAEILGNKGGIATVEPLIEALENSLILTPGDQYRTFESKEIATAASTALGKIGDARAVESLIEAMAAEHWDVSEAAAIALGKIGDARAVEPLIEALDRHGRFSYSILETTIRILGEMGDARAVEPLLKGLESDDSVDWTYENIIQAAKEALKKLGHDGK